MMGWKRGKCFREGISVQLLRLMSVPQCKNSWHSVTSQVVGKMPNLSTLSGDSTQKGEVSFEQWVFWVNIVMQSHTEVTLWEGMVQSLHRAMADLVQHLGPSIRNYKLELVHGTIISFDILMQNL